jgi:hypothetical protein
MNTKRERKKLYLLSKSTHTPHAKQQNKNKPAGKEKNFVWRRQKQTVRMTYFAHPKHHLPTSLLTFSIPFHLLTYPILTYLPTYHHASINCRREGEQTNQQKRG